MAVFLFLMAAIGGVVVVGDRVLENPSAGEVIVFTQPVSGYRQGVLLAVAAVLGVVVAVLLVASMSSTQRRRARRKQLRAIRAAIQRRAAAPAGEQAGLLDEWFGRHVPLGDHGQPVR
jgi:surface antigen